MEKIKIAISGIGRAGFNMHTIELDKFSDMYEIVGAYDPIVERMDLMCEKYPTCRKYNSFDELLADDNVELVAIANPSLEHVKDNIKALKAGKYVFAEKPIALNYADAQKLQEVAKEYPNKLFCRQNRRFEAAFQHIKEIIASKVLGEVYEIKLCRHQYQRRFDWQTLKKYGGGQLNNWGPHLIDHALQFLNYEVESVWGDVKLIASAGDANDHFKAILRGKSGLIVDVEVSNGVAIASPVYSVYGTKGTLIAYNEDEFVLKYLDMEKTAPKPVVNENTPDLTLPFHQQVHNDLVWIEEKIACNPACKYNLSDIYYYLYKAIRENEPFVVKNEESFEVVKITEMIMQKSL